MNIKRHVASSLSMLLYFEHLGCLSELWFWFLVFTHSLGSMHRTSWFLSNLPRFHRYLPRIEAVWNVSELDFR